MCELCFRVVVLLLQRKLVCYFGEYLYNIDSLLGGCLRIGFSYQLEEFEK